MTHIPLQRFAGANAALAVYGAPTLRGWRVSRTTWLAIAIAMIAVFLVAAGLIDNHALVLAAGPVATVGGAVEKREAALAKLLEAKALADENGVVAAENEDRFNALMAEFRELDLAASRASTTEDNAGTLVERMAFYTGKATGSPMRFNSTTLDPRLAKSIGRQFVESKAYKDLVASGALQSDNSRFRSDPVIIGRGGVQRMQAAATDIINTGSGQPANALVTPFYLPGALELPQRPRVIRDLFPNEDMPSGDTISYAAQTGFDNAAAAVAQATAANGSGASGGVKPQSSVAWTRRTAAAETIATWMAATRQSLADESQMASLIDNQGRTMIALEEDDQLVNGNGTSPNISGILDQPSIQTLDLTGEDNLDGVRTSRRLVKTGTSRLDPTFVILNPIDSEEFDLLKNGQGEYRGGNPIGNFGFSQPIWGLTRVESEAVAEGTAIVGARAAATIFDRQPLTVLTADQHADFFVRNLVVILFEERLAFPVFFPTGLVEVTLGDWNAS